MNKTRFADVEDTTASDMALAERQRADIQAEKFRQVCERIDEFYYWVKYVTFTSEETAPLWVNDWRGYLATGEIPLAPEPVLPDTPAPELSIVNEPDLSGIEVTEVALPERDDPPMVDTAADADFRFVEEDGGIFPPPAA